MARHALLIATTAHPDPVFARSIAPEADVRALAAALRSPKVGRFDSAVALVNRPADVVREEIEGFFKGRTEDDLLVLYVSGHTVVNARGQLQLVTATTKRDRLAATAIPADFVRDQMDECGSRQQVLILDCCHSGASVGASAGTEATFEGNGLGRIVLTASDATQFALEADDPSVNPNSMFTHILAEGLQGGAADLDDDGRITVHELYDYACRQLVQAGSKQTPGKWSYWQRDEMIIATKPQPASTDTNAVSPAKPPRPYASLRPKSVRPPSPEAGAAEGAPAVPAPPPDLARVGAPAVPAPPPDLAQVAGSRTQEAAKPQTSPQSPEPTIAEAASAVPTPPADLFAPGGPLSSSPPVEVPPSSTEGSARPSPKSRGRRPPKLLSAGAAALLVAGLATFMLTRKGSLSIEVRPNGNWSLGEITVIVDGEKKCSRSPCQVDGLAAGGHEVVVTAAGYRRQSLPVGVSRGAVNSVPMTLELDGPTGIAVADLGPDIQVFVDGQSRGFAPKEVSPLAPGEHEVRIDGGERYHSLTTRVTIEPAKMVSVAPKLKVKKGRVTVQSGQDADEAKSELVCGEERRPVPKQAFDVAAEQACKVVATKEGFEPFEQGIEFNDGEAERLITVNLVPTEKPQPSLAGNAQAKSGADGRAARLPERGLPERPRLAP